MILKFPDGIRIVDFGDALSVNKYPQKGQRVITAGSLVQSLTSGGTPSTKVNEEMSYHWMMAVLPLKLPANEKSVLNVLAFHANENGECWPSVGLLAKETCLSAREVQKCLVWLDSNNFIERQFRDGRSTTYCVNEPLSNSHHHPRPLDTQNVLLNDVKEKCSERKCKKWHMDCTAIRPNYIIGAGKRRKKA